MLLHSFRDGGACASDRGVENVEPKSSKPRKTVAAISKALKASELRVLSHAPSVSLSPTLGRGGAAVF